jgi:hypothetical protein
VFVIEITFILFLYAWRVRRSVAQLDRSYAITVINCSKHSIMFSDLN